MENAASVRFEIAVNELIFRFNIDILFLWKLFYYLKLFIIKFVISLDYFLSNCYIGEIGWGGGGGGVGSV